MTESSFSIFSFISKETRDELGDNILSKSLKTYEISFSSNLIVVPIKNIENLTKFNASKPFKIFLQFFPPNFVLLPSLFKRKICSLCDNKNGNFASSSITREPENRKMLNLEVEVSIKTLIEINVNSKFPHTPIPFPRSPRVFYREKVLK